MVKQLQQLRELVHNALERIRTLEQENAELKEKLQSYESDLSGLSQENKTLEDSQQQVELSVGELLGELQGLNLQPPEEPNTLEERDNVELKHVREAPEKNAVSPPQPEKDAEHGKDVRLAQPDASDEDLSHSLDLSLGLAGGSLLEDSKPADDEEELEIF